MANHSRAVSLRTAGSNMSSSVSSAVADPTVNKLLLELPSEILVKILGYLTFKNVSELRRVSRRFNEECASMLNTTFQTLQSQLSKRCHSIKSQMPRRQSAQRSHPLAKELSYVQTLYNRLNLLQTIFGRHIEMKQICFFPGEILDEVLRVLEYMKQDMPNLGLSFTVTGELYELSTLAWEYFDEHIKPTLPDTNFSFTSPFTVATNLSAQNGFSLNTPSCSATVTSSNHIDKGNNNNNNNGGMKKYDADLAEVKRDLKETKGKVTAQSKQIQSQSKQIQLLLKEVNKLRSKFDLGDLNSRPVTRSVAAAENNRDPTLPQPSSRSRKKARNDEESLGGKRAKKSRV